MGGSCQWQTTRLHSHWCQPGTCMVCYTPFGLPTQWQHDKIGRQDWLKVICTLIESDMYSFPLWWNSSKVNLSITAAYAHTVQAFTPELFTGRKKEKKRERETEREKRVPKERRYALTKWAQTEGDTITHKQEHSWLHSYRGWGYRVSQTLLLLPSPTGIKLQSNRSQLCMSFPQEGILISDQDI